MPYGYNKFCCYPSCAPVAPVADICGPCRGYAPVATAPVAAAPAAVAAKRSGCTEIISLFILVGLLALFIPGGFFFILLLILLLILTCTCGIGWCH